MKKRLLAIVLMIVIFMVFKLSALAETTMVLECDTESPEKLISNWNVVLDYSGKRNFVKLTDNEGNTFFLPHGLQNNTQTVPTYYWDDEKSLSITNEKLNAAICPRNMGRKMDLIHTGGIQSIIDSVTISTRDPIMLYGEKENIGKYSLDKPRYIVYEIKSETKNNICDKLKESDVKDKVCKRLIIAEGYNSKGAYAFVGPDLEAWIKDEVVKHQLKLINNKNIGFNYYKIDETDVYGEDILIIGNNSVSKLYDTWYEWAIKALKANPFLRHPGLLLLPADINNFYNDYEIEILYASSSKGKTNLEKTVKEWIENNNGDLAGYNKIIEVLEDDGFMIESDKMYENVTEGKNNEINKKNIGNLIKKLNEAQKALEEAYNVEFTDCGTGYKTSITSSITSCALYSNSLGINELSEVGYRNNGEHMVNEGFIIEGLYNDVSNILKNYTGDNGEINVIDASNDLNKYTEKFYTVVAYLRSKAHNNASELKGYEEELDNIYKNYADMVERHELNIYPVVDCETLLGDKLRDKIRSYLNIFKIAVPIILIGFGIVDFTKAVFSGEDEMKKAQQAFVKRLFIALLIFLVPTIVNIILHLANKVWPIISTDSCRIY